jgi:hypothetical protein
MAVIIASAIFLYVVLMGVTWNILITDYKCDASEPGIYLGTLFWPFILPVVLGMFIAKRGREFLTRPKRVAEALRGH